MESKSYKKLKEHLIEIGVDPIILAHLDSLTPKIQKEITNLFKESSNDKLLFVLAIKDFDFVKQYLQNRKTVQ